MQIELKQDGNLLMGNEYRCLVINYSIGRDLPVCFPKLLRYDGNDEKGQPIFSEEYWTVSRESQRSGSGQFRKYNNDNCIVVGILPDHFHSVVHGSNRSMDARSQFQLMCKFTPVPREDDFN